MADAYHNIHITTQPNGTAWVQHLTNDDDDDGYDDGRETTWPEEYNTVQMALDRLGVSRTGISGIRVTVWLDGKKVEG